MGERWTKASGEMGRGLINVAHGACIAAALAVLFALISGVARLAIFLRAGETPNSLCETIAYISELDKADCLIRTEWIGFNHLSNWLILGADASIGALIVAFILLMIAALFGLTSKAFVNY